MSVFIFNGYKRNGERLGSLCRAAVMRHTRKKKAASGKAKKPKEKS